MNIFEIHSRTTSRYEPLHSRYLAECIKSDGEFLSRLWLLATSSHPEWPVPVSPRIENEYNIGNGRRIDLAMLDEVRYRLLGVEVKTSDSSVEFGQLETYRQDLVSRHPGYDVWICFLTPFNLANAPRGPRGRKAVEEFTRFHSQYNASEHLSWSDIATLRPQKDYLWDQHCSFVRQVICKHPSELASWGRLEDDITWEVMQEFWQLLGSNNFDTEDGKVILRRANSTEFLMDAFRKLIDSPRVRRSVKGVELDSVPKREFLETPFGNFHGAIFDLLKEYPFLSLRGKRDYGLILPVEGPRPKVSICTVKLSAPNVLIIGRSPGLEPPDNSSEDMV